MLDTSRKAVFLDRDGTIIRDRNYLCDPDGVELLPRAAEGLLRMTQLGFCLVVVTNQSGVGRGKFGIHEVEAVHRRLRELLREEGVELDAIYVCLHSPDDNCSCRKPRTELAGKAAEDLNLDLRRCFVIGDKGSDIEFGRAIGAQSILIGATHQGEQIADSQAIDLLEAAEQIASFS